MTGGPRVATALVALGLAGALTACGSQVPTVQVEARPSPSPTPSETSPSPSESPSPTETSPFPSETSPSPTETESRVPSDTDRARFVAGYQPSNASGLQHVATDLDGDGVKEVLFAYVRGGQVSHVDIAWWTGTTYEIVVDEDGGPASRIASLRAADVNRDGRTEIVVAQTGESGASVTLWQVVGARQVVGLPAAGGCHDGSNTYGHDGVSFEDRDADGIDEIHATCPDGGTHRYRWETGAYRHAPALIE